MNKYVSVFALFVRAALGKVLTALGVLTVAETGMWIVATKFTELSFHATVEQALFLQMFQVLWYVLAVLLMLSPGFKDSKPGYTLRRLAVSEKAAMYLQAACNAFMLLLACAWQLALALCFAGWHHSLHPHTYSHQTLLLEFYKSPLLHNLLPQGDYVRWMANGVMVLLFGMCTARTAYLLRRGKRAIGSMVLVLMMPTMLSPDRSGDGGMVLDLICVCFGLVALALCVIVQRDWEEATDDG